MMRPNRSRHRRRKAFTLMEVLLVLAILVILGSLVSVSYVTIQRNSKISSTRTQINFLRTALDVYQADVGYYPSDLSALRQPPTDLTNPKKWKGPYIDKEIPNDPWDNPYQYELTTDEFGRQQPVLVSYGPDRQQGTEDDISSLDTVN